MMPQDGDLSYEESFNSFLAGVLLTRNCIDYFDFFDLMNKFTDAYNVDIVSIGEDFCVPVYLDDNEIKLRKNFDDVILVNGKNITIRNYLYSITSSRVRDFFGFKDLKKGEKKKDKEGKIKPFVKILFKKKIAI